jgi:hypothetical protein
MTCTFIKKYRELKSNGSFQMLYPGRNELSDLLHTSTRILGVFSGVLRVEFIHFEDA